MQRGGGRAGHREGHRGRQDHGGLHPAQEGAATHHQVPPVNQGQWSLIHACNCVSNNLFSLINPIKICNDIDTKLNRHIFFDFWPLVGSSKYFIK